MKLRFLATGLAMATLTMSLATIATADETGMAGIHDWRLERGKTCLVGHYHSGSSSGSQRSKKAAMRSAIVAWQEFTAAEYGTDWAYFKNANSKSASCGKSSYGWSCSIEGRPCNRKRRRRR